MLEQPYFEAEQAYHVIQAVPARLSLTLLKSDFHSIRYTRGCVIQTTKSSDTTQVTQLNIKIGKN